MFLQLNIIDVETRRRRMQIHTPNRVGRHWTICIDYYGDESKLFL